MPSDLRGRLSVRFSEPRSAGLTLFLRIGQVLHGQVPSAPFALGVRQRVARPFGPGAAVVHDVRGQVDGVAHRLRVGLVLSGDVERHAVIGRCPYAAQAGREIHPVGREGLERRESLIVIHG